jgi:hypothetical protein
MHSIWCFTFALSLLGWVGGLNSAVSAAVVVGWLGVHWPKNALLFCPCTIFCVLEYQVYSFAKADAMHVDNIFHLTNHDAASLWSAWRSDRWHDHPTLSGKSWLDEETNLSLHDRCWRWVNEGERWPGSKFRPWLHVRPSRWVWSCGTPL